MDRERIKQLIEDACTRAYRAVRWRKDQATILSSTTRRVWIASVETGPDGEHVVVTEVDPETGAPLPNDDSTPYSSEPPDDFPIHENPPPQEP